LQQSHGRFTEAAEQWGLAFKESGPMAWLDLDRDQRPEMLRSANGKFFVLRIVDGRYYQSILNVGVKASLTKIIIADFDADGDIDALGVGFPNILLENRGGVLKAIDPVALGLPEHSVDANWVDVDNDGYLDLHAVPTGVHMQNVDGRFVSTGQLRPRLPSVLSGNRVHRSIGSWADLNNDGTRDLIMTRLAVPKTEDWLVGIYHNHLDSNRWLQIDLQGMPGNVEALGSIIDICVESRCHVQYVGQWEGSRYSSGHYRLYVGAGLAESVNSVRVTWPDGSQTVAENLPTNQRITLRYDLKSPEGIVQSGSKETAN
jgi:hypothetical protein